MSRPVINLEPNYEFHLAYQSKKPFNAFHVRRALYWSLLISPTCGVSYGNHGIWCWAEKDEIPIGHPESGIAPSWKKALKSEGANSVKILKTFFSSINWWKLIPFQDLLIEQLGTIENPYKKIVASKSEDDDFAIVYIPEGGMLSLKTDFIKRPAVAKWFNVRTGNFLNEIEISEKITKLKTPDSEDWILLISKKL
ncbi:MAG: glycoside hydrolase family 140 protein [Candidatus Omnitrophica bacterium]|nr:glycoside hydrolase family 140 protein [Candidatus Omnitrophota bacterium]